MCLICLHRSNHLTATSRRVKFTSNNNDDENACMGNSDQMFSIKILLCN